MSLRLLGESVLARDANGQLCNRVATIFPRHRTLVTLPGIHATQRWAFVELVNEERVGQGLPPLTAEEQDALLLEAVDLVIEDCPLLRDDVVVPGVTVLIRPDPENMAMAFEADELLQQGLISKKRIKYLHVLEQRVRDAIVQRGECWRIAALPRSPEEMRAMVERSRICISGRHIYYYNRSSGAHLLTCHQFRDLARLSDMELSHQLQEVRDYCTRSNRQGTSEIVFFACADPDTLRQTIRAYDFLSLPPDQLRAAHAELSAQFDSLVDPQLRNDDLDNPVVRAALYAALLGKSERYISEEELLGFSAEFFMQVEWLPGGRLVDGELIFDSVFEEEEEDASLRPDERVCDPMVRGFIINYIREYGDLKSINIGCVVGSMSKRSGGFMGRRGVYVAEIFTPDSPQPILRIIRLQKWGVRERLDDRKDLLTAILASEDYTDYIMDRRLGCRQLGMNLTQRTTARRISERYFGENPWYHGQFIWTSYFEREYIAGVATDKIANTRYHDDAFAMLMASKLGKAAAPNLIVGRTTVGGKVIFDDGDELVMLDEQGMPRDLLVADHTGTFQDFTSELAKLASAYALPVLRRREHLRDPAAFAERMLEAFTERFTHIRSEYLHRKRAFDSLFKHLRRDENGSFSFRWECVLARLEKADPAELTDVVRQRLRQEGVLPATLAVPG